MPRLWNETIVAHRREVRDTVLRTTAMLVSDRGLRSVTMSEIAERSGIGRATLYKYFPDVEAILIAWHERQVADHLERLTEARDRTTGPAARIGAVLRAYALTVHESQGNFDADLTAFLHRGEAVDHARSHLRTLVADLIAEAATTGDVRDDVETDELVSYCLHALSAARSLPSKVAVERLVDLTLAGLRPPRENDQLPPRQG